MRIDIHADPPAADAIIKQRVLTIVESPASKAMLLCPIPFLDIIAYAVVKVADRVKNGDPDKPWADVPGAADADWSATLAGSRYVSKVRAMGRALVELEVQELLRDEGLKS